MTSTGLRVVGVVAALGLAVLSAAFAAPGQLDGSFGSGGKVLTDLGAADWAGSAAVTRGGAVVVVGGSGDDLAVARYDPAGRLDPGFGGDGTVVTDLGGGNDGAGGVAVQPDGKVVVAGQRNGELALLRYSAAGTLDPSFDGDGVVVTELGLHGRALAVVHRSGGKLLAVGGDSDGLVLARFLGDGRLDAGFGRGGVVRTPSSGIDWRIAVPGRDGTIVVAGARLTTRPVQALAPAVARYLPDGRLDRTFARDGLVVLAPRPHWAGAVEVDVDRSGRIVLGMHGHDARGRVGFALMRLRRDGGLDATFGHRGVSVGGIGYGVHALALDPRGRIVTAGRTTSLLDFVVARFLPDGRLDRAFATTVTDFGGIDTPFGLTLQPDGNVVVVGASSPGRGTLAGDIAVARYLSAG